MSWCPMSDAVAVHVVRSTTAAQKTGPFIELGVTT